MTLEGHETAIESHINEEKQVSEGFAREEEESNQETKSFNNDENMTKEKEESEITESSETKTEQEETEEQSSPRGVLEIPVTGSGSGSGSDSDHSIDRSSSSGSEKSMVEKKVAGELSNGNLQWKKILGQLKRRSSWRFSTIMLLGGYDFLKTTKKKLWRLRSSDDAMDCGDFVVPKPSWRNFSYEELKHATDDFSSDKLIGKGGHAEVYKGSLSDGQVVAVKKITKKGKNDEERVGDFLSELGIIAHIDHPNAAKFIGFSSDNGLHLVLQFLPHGSLATLLHGSEETSLEWKIRYKVAIGVAEGLEYLHYNCQRRVIHRDITASNILLSEDYEAQISDFGLAKWLPENWVHHVVSPIEGTFGYMAPEYFMHGIVNEKTDVFAFGVLLLELITGRRAVDSSRQSLVMWAKSLLEKNNVKEVADPRLGETYDIIEMKRAMYTASTCIHHSPTMRPNIKRVLQLLRGENGVDMKQKPMGGRTMLVDACDLDDYTCTTYLKDLNRHRELIME